MKETELRALVGRVQEQVALLASTAPSAAPSENDKRELTRRWDQLVQHLALGPAPDTRVCPSCSHTIMRAATLCGYCWMKLPEGGRHA
ncbi:MAG: hypothetical protein HYV09_14255 [Deltaproteobacteria bacterium]|nr:hypothetical protein [Deltaproteobacteria bacterium]